MSSPMPVIEPGSLSEWVLRNKYCGPRETSWPDVASRVAFALTKDTPQPAREERYGDLLRALVEFRFLPGGRILAGAGLDRQVTLFNCFVMGEIEDSLEGIHRALGEAALTMKQGGGVGMDFSTLRPRGARVHGVDSISSGAVSFMSQWDAMCGTIMSAGARRGAMMGVLRADHPDIEEFIEAKQTPGRLTNFNLSVGVTDEFMLAVRNASTFDLRFNGELVRTVDAAALWEKILRSTYDHAEPGVIFLDRINATNPIETLETICATNPCGEQPLPPYGACLLGSINLATHVRDPFGIGAHVDGNMLRETIAVAVRALDAVIDVSGYPLEAQRAEALAKRRIGLGITGLADALIMCGLRYDTSDARERAASWMKLIRDVAMNTSIDLGRQHGPFPVWGSGKLHGPERRNSHLLSIAPTGTISILAGDVAGGIEPTFQFAYDRTVLQPDGSKRSVSCQSYAHRLYQHIHGRPPAYGGEWVTALDIDPADHVAMVTALQPYIDGAISKTINCPAEMPFESFRQVYDRAYDDGAKGCTTYRPTPSRGAVLVAKDDAHKSDSNVVPLRPPQPRPERLAGTTYKIKPPGQERALYMTVNDIEEGGRRRPFEVFFSTKDVAGGHWLQTLALMISAVFRQSRDASFVWRELMEIHDPRGGFWEAQQYVPSIEAAIGRRLRDHMAGHGETPTEADEVAVAARHCPKCQTGRLRSESGCWSCDSCDYTKC